MLDNIIGFKLTVIANPQGEPEVKEHVHRSLESGVIAQYLMDAINAPHSTGQWLRSQSVVGGRLEQFKAQFINNEKGHTHTLILRPIYDAAAATAI